MKTIGTLIIIAALIVLTNTAIGMFPTRDLGIVFGSAMLIIATIVTRHNVFK